jgi:hypothetical protein
MKTCEIRALINTLNDIAAKLEHCIELHPTEQYFKVLASDLHQFVSWFNGQILGVVNYPSKNYE